MLDSVATFYKEHRLFPDGMNFGTASDQLCWMIRNAVGPPINNMHPQLVLNCPKSCISELRIQGVILRPRIPFLTPFGTRSFAFQDIRRGYDLPWAILFSYSYGQLLNNLK